MFIKVLQSYSSCKLIKIINYFNCYAWHDLNLTYATILFKLLWYVKASISPCVCDFSFLLILKSIFKLRNIMCKYIIWNLISLFFCTRIHLARKYHLNEELRHIVIRSDEFERNACFFYHNHCCRKTTKDLYPVYQFYVTIDNYTSLQTTVQHVWILYPLHTKDKLNMDIIFR